MEKSQEDEDDSWLNDEVIDEDEPLPKRPCLETSVSQLVSLAATSEASSTSVASGTCTTVDNNQPSSSSILDNIAPELQMEATCSPRIHYELATIVNNLARQKLPDETLATKYKLYEQLKNCDARIIVKVDPPKWDKLKL